jgi:hypothetical protein
MKYRNTIRGAMTILFVLVVSGCGEATDVPVVPFPAETSLPAPVQPTTIQPLPTEIPPTQAPAGAATLPAAAGTDAATTPDGTVSPTVTSTPANPLDLPFLMRIDRVSVVVGRGTLVEGRVEHGTLQAGDGVEILRPQAETLSPGLLAILVSSVAREQVTVGDYAGILVESVDATQVTPGTLLAEAGAYDSYEDALANLP